MRGRPSANQFLLLPEAVQTIIVAGGRSIRFVKACTHLGIARHLRFGKPKAVLIGDVDPDCIALS